MSGLGNGSIGIDLGLKTLATCTDGSKIPALQHYRQYEKALGIAQRAGNKKRVKTIHAKIANTRRHHLHVQSTRIVRENKQCERLQAGQDTDGKICA
jgi:putative transposase